MKKVLGLILAAIMLAAVPCTILAPQAEADGAETVFANEQTGKIVNCKTACNVRAKATKNSKLLGTAEKGEEFTVLGKSGNWVKIDFNGKEGYVYKTYIRVSGIPTDTPVEGKVGKIVNCKTAVNVRKKATTDSKLLGTAKKGEVFKVLATAGDWVKIAYKEDVEGYVYKTYIKITDEETETPIEGKYGKIVNCKKAVNVRAKATKDSKLLGTAEKGETFRVLGKSGKWIKVDFNGKTGYIYHTYIKLIDEKEAVKGKIGKIVDDDICVREMPKSRSTLLGTADKGEIFRILGKNGNWYKIDFKGVVGFVYETHIKID